MSVITMSEIEDVVDLTTGVEGRMTFSDAVISCERVAALVEERCKRRLNVAVNEECSCGGSEPGPGACPACMVWHKYRAQYEADRETK